MTHNVAFIVRTKGFEDERIIKEDACEKSQLEIISQDKFLLTEPMKMNILFNNAVLIAMQPERKFKDTFIFMDGTTLIACVKTNHQGKQNLYYYMAKPKYLSLLQKRIK